MIMNNKEIEEKFSEMGLGTSEQRERIVEELAINPVVDNSDSVYEIKTCKNTLIAKHYA